MATALLAYLHSILTIVLIAYSLRRSLTLPHTAPLKKHLIVWAQFGALFGLYTFTWLYATYPIAWLAPGVTQVIGACILHLILIGICALSFSVIALTFHHSSATRFRFIIFGLLIALGEILRSLLISTRSTTCDH